jgi:tRNA threonylcarbamoyl adenosine modification protein (Sua5/YciO/YrdC/YwlC family)
MAVEWRPLGCGRIEIYSRNSWVILLQQSTVKTEVLKIYTLDDTVSIQKAAQLLDSGSLVAFPTETVYGIGCKVDKHSLERLNEVKDRPSEKRYTLHIGNHEQLAHYIPQMNLKTRKLVQHALPGPVTVVFELDKQALKQARKNLGKNIYDLLYTDGTLGVRYPDNPAACAVLSQAKSPVVAPSANPAGQQPAVTTQQVRDYFDGKIDAVLDAPGFGSLYQQSSTVVKIGKQGIQVLREGAVPSDQIRDWSTLQILFVCTGNTCRSPMAAGFCRKFISDILGCPVDELDELGYKVDSAGIAALDGIPASGHAVEVCQQQRIDLASHRSRQLTLRDIQQSDLIFTMSQSHRAYILQTHPLASDKCFMLDPKKDIQDPVGLNAGVYRNCFHQISENIIARKGDIL